MLKIYPLIIVLIYLLELSSSQQFIGDACTLKASGHPRVCKLLSECPQASEDLQKNNSIPQTCGFQKTQAIVCCPGKPEGEISKQKCREYSAYVFPKTKAPILITGGLLVTRNECGHRTVKLIVGGDSSGGEPAGRREFPHMAAIGFEATPGDVQWLCGGTIISKNYILAAAHCLSDYSRGDAKWVLIGVSDLNSTSKHRQVIKVADRIPHTEYRSGSHYHDIGLIRLETPARMNTYARPACLNLKQEISDKIAIITGFGQTNWDGTERNNLLKITVDLYDHDFCNSSYKNQISRKLKYGVMDDTQFCAGSVHVEEDTCQRDSGGPLQIYHKGDDIKCMYDIVGLSSFGKACSRNSEVYVRVSHYVKWIEDIVWSS